MKTDETTRVLQVLKRGEKYGLNDLKAYAHTEAPEAALQALRAAGVPIGTEWQTTFNGHRFKVWYLKTTGKASTK